MITPDALHAQIAQRLFGWTRVSTSGWGDHTLAPSSNWARWRRPDGQEIWRLPAYTTDPAATAQVWRWVEAQEGLLQEVDFEYNDQSITCYLAYARGSAVGHGATWPEALCRAALALAEAVGEEGAHGA